MFKTRVSQQLLTKLKMPVQAPKFSTSSVKGDLFKFQTQLPKLPVPNLQETAQKYLKSVEPYLSKEQLNETTSKVSEFIKSGGDRKSVV